MVKNSEFDKLVKTVESLSAKVEALEELVAELTENREE